jgi:hypothetical protein
MCDFSLHTIASRPARVGDRLVTTSFVGTYTRGFAASDEPKVAVCLRPGTELVFDRDIDWDMPFKMFRRKRPFGKLVRFRQVNLHNPHTHHDAVEFPNGAVILATRLCKGQRATVLQLPPASQAVHHTEADAKARVIDLVATRVDSAS